MKINAFIQYTIEVDDKYPEYCSFENPFSCPGLKIVDKEGKCQIFNVTLHFISYDRIFYCRCNKCIVKFGIPAPNKKLGI